MIEVREKILLSGEWDLAFDPANTGKKKGWFKNFPKQTKKMAVPGVWEQLKPGYDGVGWYKRIIKIEKNRLNKVVRIEFKAANYFAEVYINGKFAGSHEGGYTPFIFDISGLIREGENTVTVRVINPPINSEIEGFRTGAPLNKGDLPIGKAGWYYNFGGLWQDVFLHITGKTYTEDCFIESFIREKKTLLNLKVRNNGKAGSCEVVCRISPKKNPGEVVAEKKIKVKLKNGENLFKVELVFKQFNLWSNTDPFLYEAAVEIFRDFEKCDSGRYVFGMREFKIEKGSFYLNGKKIFLKGFLHQGSYARTLSFPHSRELCLKELRMVKDGGFNFLRIHLKPAPYYYLDMADEMGLLILEEPPTGWLGKTGEMHNLMRRLQTEVRELILRDRNHPSIIMWCLLNEAYHFRGMTIPEVVKLKNELGLLGRKYDPTRLLIDTSGGLAEHDKPTLTDVRLPYSNKMLGIMDLHDYCPLPVPDRSLVRYRTKGQKGVVIYASEYGAPLVPPDYEKVLNGYTPAERKLGLEDYILHRDFYVSCKKWFDKDNLKKVFGNMKGLTDAVNEVRALDLKHITSEMRSNPNYDGIALCQLSDASGELFGATDVWREPKPLFNAMVTACQVPLLAPEILPRLISEKDNVTLRATLINEDMLGISYFWSGEIVTKSGKVIKTFKGKVHATGCIQTPLLKKIGLNLKAGTYGFRTTLLNRRKIVSRDEMEFTVIKEAALEPKLIAVFEKEHLLENYIKSKGVVFEDFHNNYRKKNVPVLFDLRKAITEGHIMRENVQQMRKAVQLGGCAVLFEAETINLFELVFPMIIRQEYSMARGVDYVKKHALFDGLPSGCIMGYEYANIYPARFTKAEDIKKAGGEVVAGSLSPHMWTRPAEYYWGAALSIIPLGKGHIIVPNFRIIDNLGKDKAADRLFANIVNYANKLIKKGGEEKMIYRCIDPLGKEF